MKERLKKFINYLIVKYVPCSDKIVEKEAYRLSKFISDNYNENEQIMILTQLKLNIIEHRENQIKNKNLLLLQEESNLKYLNQNLQTLINLK